MLDGIFNFISSAKAKSVTNFVIAPVALTMKDWRQDLMGVSEIAGMIVPILTGAWIVLQIIGWFRNFLMDRKTGHDELT